MLKNNKGFSLLELLSIIAILSALMVPLLQSFTKTLELNRVQHTKRSALAISRGTLYGFDKLDFVDIRSLVDTANGAGSYYIEFNESNCANLASAGDEALCTSIFTSIHNNLTLDSTTFRVFIYDFNLSAGELTSLTSNASIPIQVRDAITASSISDGSITNILRITVWILYETEPTNHYYVISGVIDNE